MNTKQHNTTCVERTFCASGLLGRPGQQRRTDRGYLDSSLALVWEPAAMFGLSGLSTVIPNFGQINLIA
jgi:hypothetical protein